MLGGLLSLVANGKQDLWIVGDEGLQRRIDRLNGILCYWSEKKCDKHNDGSHYCKDHLPLVQAHVIKLGCALLKRPDINRDMRTYLMKTLFYRWSIQYTPSSQPAITTININIPPTRYFSQKID